MSCNPCGGKQAWSERLVRWRCLARPYTLCWRHVKLGRALLNHDDDDRDDDDRDDDDRDDDDDDAALATVAAHRRPGTARQTAARVTYSSQVQDLA